MLLQSYPGCVITPTGMLQALTESLPASPAAGPPGAQAPAPARTPQTGKKRAREGTEGMTNQFGNFLLGFIDSTTNPLLCLVSGSP